MPAVFSVAFDGDLRTVEGNPFRVESAFGRPVTIGWGDAFAEAQRLREALEAIADGEGDPAEIARQALDAEPST